MSAGQYRDRKIANRSFENLSHFVYSGMTVTNENLIQEKIKRRLNSGNALLPFSPELSVFSCAVERHKKQNIQDYNFACGSAWT
jgi:hypothetical protein